jgi:hypothetical protein
MNKDFEYNFKNLTIQGNAYRNFDLIYLDFFLEIEENFYCALFFEFDKSYNGNYFYSEKSLRNYKFKLSI